MLYLLRPAANVRLRKAFKIVWNLFHGATKQKSWLPQALDNHGHWENTVTKQPSAVTPVRDAA